MKPTLGSDCDDDVVIVVDVDDDNDDDGVVILSEFVVVAWLRKSYGLSQEVLQQCL